MTVLHHQIRIEAPRDAVWKVLADLPAVAQYNPLVASAKYVSPAQDGVGAARRCELKPKGFVEERVWEWQPPHTLGLEVAASEWPLAFMKWRTELREDGAATLVTQEMSYKPKFGPFGALMNLLMMRRMLDKNIGEVFVALKRFVESRRNGLEP